MRSYALTYPQLLAKARASGADDDTLARLRTGYEACQVLFQGFHRGIGEPFECHMVRTASVVLAEGQPLPVVLAAMLHSAYDLDRYGDSTRRPPRASDRRRVREQIGVEAEALVWDFHTLTWPHGIDTYLEELPEATEAHRQVLLLCLANELVNHLDLGAVYGTRWPLRERLGAFGDAIVELARAMERTVLADELATAFEESLDHECWSPDVGHTGPYELSGRRPLQASRVRRLYVKTRPVRGRLIRLVRRPSVH